MEELINLVDGSGARVGQIEKLDAHKKGLLHEAFSIFIFDSKGNMLLQKRAASKYHSGGLWTNACCSHPRVGEVPAEAVHRRLQEEMGIDADLREVYAFTYRITFDNGLTEYEYDRVFVGKSDADPEPNPAEADEWKRMGMHEIAADLVMNPQAYTYWFKVAFPQVRQYCK